MPQTARKQLSAADWEVGALELLAEKGIAAVAVEPLARRLGVTKGSFYWHFPNRDALLEAALARWEAEDVRTFERTLNRFNLPRDKVLAVFRHTVKEMRSHVMYCAVFKAAEHPLVGPIIQRVSRGRIEFLARGYRALGLAPGEAMHRARLTYLAYVGFLQYYQLFKADRMSRDELDEYVEHVIATLVPESAQQ